MTSKEIALNYECPVCGAKPNMPCFGIPEDDPSRDPFDWRPAELMTPHKARETAYNRQNAAESLPAALVQETAVCPKCNRPHYNMEDSEFCRSMHDEEETPCPKREDGIHCNCWYDGNPCCACEDGKPETVAETKPTPFADETLTCPHGVGRCVCRICNGINWDPLKPQPDSSSIPDEIRYKTSEEAEKLPLIRQIARLKEINAELCDTCNSYIIMNANAERRIKELEHRDSSSISTEQTFEEAWKAAYPSMCDMTFAMSRALKEVGEKLWNAAKGQSNGR